MRTSWAKSSLSMVIEPKAVRSIVGFMSLLLDTRPAQSASRDRLLAPRHAALGTDWVDRRQCTAWNSARSKAAPPQGERATRSLRTLCAQPFFVGAPQA